MPQGVWGLSRTRSFCSAVLLKERDLLCCAFSSVASGRVPAPTTALYPHSGRQRVVAGCPGPPMLPSGSARKVPTTDPQGQLQLHVTCKLPCGEPPASLLPVFQLLFKTSTQKPIGMCDSTVADVPMALFSHKPMCGSNCFRDTPPPTPHVSPCPDQKNVISHRGAFGSCPDAETLTQA